MAYRQQEMQQIVIDSCLMYYCEQNDPDWKEEKKGEKNLATFNWSCAKQCKNDVNRSDTTWMWRCIASDVSVICTMMLAAYFSLDSRLFTSSRNVAPQQDPHICLGFNFIGSSSLRLHVLFNFIQHCIVEMGKLLSNRIGCQ